MRTRRSYDRLPLLGILLSGACSQLAGLDDYSVRHGGQESLEDGAAAGEAGSLSQGDAGGALPDGSGPQNQDGGDAGALDGAAALPASDPAISSPALDASAAQDAAGLLDAKAPAADSAVPTDTAVPSDSAGPRDGAAEADANLGDAGAKPDSGPSLDPEPGRLAGITAAHNAARARVPTASALPSLSWSATIAAIAQSYANKLATACSGPTHSTPQERMNWGENLALTSGSGGTSTGTAQEVVALWESEVSCYTYGAFQAGINTTCSSACSASGGCGHYTQIVWRATRQVGCGVAECTSGTTRRSYWVCNYDPAGNFIGQMPY
jgi:pathogenesis-related protein 1